MGTTVVISKVGALVVDQLRGFLKASTPEDTELYDLLWSEELESNVRALTTSPLKMALHHLRDALTLLRTSDRELAIKSLDMAYQSAVESLEVHGKVSGGWDQFHLRFDILVVYITIKFLRYVQSGRDLATVRTELLAELADRYDQLGSRLEKYYGTPYRKNWLQYTNERKALEQELAVAREKHRHAERYLDDVKKWTERTMSACDAVFANHGEGIGLIGLTEAKLRKFRELETELREAQRRQGEMIFKSCEIRIGIEKSEKKLKELEARHGGVRIFGDKIKGYEGNVTSLMQFIRTSTPGSRGGGTKLLC